MDGANPVKIFVAGRRSARFARRVTFDASLAETLRTFQALPEIRPQIDRAAELVINTLRAGNKVLLCGNGGSAAEAQHFATELVGRYARNRRPLPAIALTADGSLLTCIGNDFGYEGVFARQIAGLAQPGDLVHRPHVQRPLAQHRGGADGGQTTESSVDCVSGPGRRQMPWARDRGACHSRQFRTNGAGGAPFSDPLFLRVDRRSVCLRRNHAEQLTTKHTKHTKMEVERENFRPQTRSPVSEGANLLDSSGKRFFVYFVCFVVTSD